STANDLLRFISAYAGITPSPLSTLMRKAQALQTLESGEKRRLAWDGNESLFEHGGLMDGFQAELAFDVNERRGVVVLSNCRPYSILVTEIWRPLLDGRSLRPPMTVPVYPEVLERYVGQYRYDKKSGGLEVRRDGGRLVAQWIGPSMRFAPYEVFPCSETVFRNEFWGVQAEFFPNSGYKTDSVVLSSIGPYSGLQKPIKLTKFSTKVSESPPFVRPSSKVYENDAGQYRKTLLFGLIRIGPTLSISHQKDEVGDHLTASARGFGSAEVFPISEST